MFKRAALFVVAMVVSFAAAAADSYKAGVHYAELPFAVKTKDPSKVEVVEMFGYPCPHCNSFEPVLEHWEKKVAADVDFQRIPVIFGRSWEPFARAYYTSELLKSLDKTHGATFNAVHVERRRLRNEDDFTKFYSDLGVDGGKFAKYFNSFAVNAKMKQGDSRARSYEITGVPSMVVNGKYRVTAQMAGGQKQMLDVVNFLVEKERQAK